MDRSPARSSVATTMRSTTRERKSLIQCCRHRCVRAAAGRLVISRQSMHTSWPKPLQTKSQAKAGLPTTGKRMATSKHGCYSDGARQKTRSAIPCRVTTPTSVGIPWGLGEHKNCRLQTSDCRSACFTSAICNLTSAVVSFLIQPGSDHRGQNRATPEIEHPPQREIARRCHPRCLPEVSGEACEESDHGADFERRHRSRTQRWPQPHIKVRQQDG